MAIQIKGKVFNLSSASTFAGAAAASITNEEILCIDDLRAAPAASTAVKQVWGTGVTIPAHSTPTSQPAVNIVSDGRIFNFELNATYAALGIRSAETKNVSVLNSSIVTTTLAAYGIGTEKSADNLFGMTILGNYIDAAGHGILLDIDSSGQDPSKPQGGFLVAANRVFSGRIDSEAGTRLGDGIEINVPGIEFIGGVISGNWIKHYGDDTDFTGMGIGIANPQDFAVVGNSIQGASKEVIHLEDNHKGIVVVGNVGRGPYDGIKLNPPSHAPFDQRPATVVGNNVGWDDVNGPNTNTTYGISLFYSNPCSPSGNPIIGNVVRDYDVGISAGGVGSSIGDNPAGPVLNIIDGNSILNCESAMQMYGSKRSKVCVQVGTNYAEGCDYLFQPEASGCGTFGKVVSRTHPTRIFKPVTYSGMPFTCEGFAYPVPEFNSVAGTIVAYTFPQTLGPSFGRLYFHCQASGSFDTWLQYWCEFSLKSDGTLIKSEDFRVGPGSLITNITLVENGTTPNLLQIEVTAAAPPPPVSGVFYQINWLDVSGRLSDA